MSSFVKISEHVSNETANFDLLVLIPLFCKFLAFSKVKCISPDSDQRMGQLLDLLRTLSQMIQMIHMIIHHFQSLL